MQDYPTIIGIIDMRLRGISYEDCCGRYKVGHSTVRPQLGTNLKKHQPPHREKLVQAVVINDLSFQIQCASHNRFDSCQCNDIILQPQTRFRTIPALILSLFEDAVGRMH